MVTLYGIPNCNTVKKARDWLAAQDIEYTFHDFKKQGVSADKLTQWLETIPQDKLINRAGMTWRKLDDTTKATITDEASAVALMIEKTSVIKRPVLEKDGQVLTVGFKEDNYQQLLIG